MLSIRLAEYVSAGRGFSGDDVLRDSSLPERSDAVPEHRQLHDARRLQ